MNSHVITELAYNLRCASFPNNAQEFLQKLEHIYVSYKANGLRWTPEVFIELINPFLYNVTDVRDIKRTKLTPIQQLQLADMILNYLTIPREDGDRQTLFNTIFYSINFQKADVPLRILGLVGSLAVAFRKYETLHCMALWMSAAGLENPAVISIALDLSKDFVTDEFPEKYVYLPQRAYLFTAVFLIAIGKAYKTVSPPQRLIDQVTVWIETSPRVGFIPPQSAVFDLFRWCIHSHSHEEEQDNARLHLALMSAIDREGKGAQLQVIPHIMTLIQELRVKRDRLMSTNSNGVAVSVSAVAPVAVERGVDMLFQLIQMLIATECLDRNEIHPIFESTEEARLPRTELYDMMKSLYFR